MCLLVKVATLRGHMLHARLKEPALARLVPLGSACKQTREKEEEKKRGCSHDGITYTAKDEEEWQRVEKGTREQIEESRRERQRVE